MIKAFLKGINVKRLTYCIVAVFVFIFLTNFLIHEVILKKCYLEAASAFRSEHEMKGLMVWMILGQFLLVKFFCVIFAKGYEGKGLGEGARYGLLIGLFMAGMSFIEYVVYPVTWGLLWSWVGLGIVQWVGAGMVAATVYSKKK